MMKLYKLLIVPYIALLTIMLATPALAITPTTYTDTKFNYGALCCGSETSAQNLGTCLEKAAAITSESKAKATADNCIDASPCQSGACTGTSTTNALLNIGEPCNGDGDGNECASGSCGATSNLCQMCTLSSGDCFGEEKLLPLGKGCNTNLKGADCASGYCSPITGTCGEIITPSATTPTGGGEPVKSIKLPNFLFTEDPNDVIGRVIEFVIGLAGTAALAMFIYGGVRWLTSGGDAEGIKKGREAMQWAAIGLVIVFSSYVLVKFVLQVIGSTAGA